MYEIEKRWYVTSDIPKDNIIKTIRIEQTYANLNPDVRIRKTIDNDKEIYSHCVKYNISKNIREELETEISKEQYENIFKYINKKPIVKDRILVKLDNDLVAEVDNFVNENKIIVEVEFKSEEEMKSFIKPDWFGEEIEEGKMYSASLFSIINNCSNGRDMLKYLANGNW